VPGQKNRYLPAPPPGITPTPAGTRRASWPPRRRHLGQGDHGSRPRQPEQGRRCRCHLCLLSIGGQLLGSRFLSRPVRALQAFVLSQKDGSWGKAIHVAASGNLTNGGESLINSVSCSAAGTCSAAGCYEDSLGADQAIVVTQDEGTWGKAVEIPGHAGSQQGRQRRRDLGVLRPGRHLQRSRHLHQRQRSGPDLRRRPDLTTPQDRQREMSPPVRDYFGWNLMPPSNLMTSAFM
jgi:hypothetical protein